MVSGKESSDHLRFPGLHPAARGFFRELELVPCPSSWPGEDRVAYATYILGPFKALVGDLARRLGDVSDTISLEARVGLSLAWPREVAPESADCPVRTIRAWDRNTRPAVSPLLVVGFSGRDIEIALDAAGADPAASRQVREALLEPSEDARVEAATLVARGWTVTGPDAGLDGEHGDLPDGIRPWFAHSPLRVSRRLAWEPWLGEPGFVLEVADRFRELLPLFERMRVPHSAPATSLLRHP